MKLTPLRTLALRTATHAGGSRHLSAASGLVVTGGRLHVVGDDAHHLAVFDVDDPGPGSLVRLFPGDLPHDADARKACKPDLETLFRTPPWSAAPHGSLMAFGSGSRPQRQRAAWLALDATGAPDPDASGILSLGPLYEPLRERFADLNIEGAFVDRGQLRLLQRGHAGARDNACIAFDWQAVAAWLGRGGEDEAPPVVSVQRFDLGDIDGVPLGFTDAAPWRDGAWLFSAVAEATSDSYLDGACVGAAVGLVDGQGQLQRVSRLDEPWKIEGLAVLPGAGATQLLLVTDPDDPARAAQLLGGTWP